MRPLKNLHDCVTEAKKQSNRSRELDASFRVEINGQNWTCYTVAVAHHEFILFCDEGTATFVVDQYGDRFTFELIDWEIDGGIS